MVLALVAILIGAGAGLASGGDSSGLSTFRPIGWWLIPLSACLYGLGILDADGAGEPVLAAMSLAALLAFAVGNIRTPGLGVVAVGLALNLVPLALNGATVITADLVEEVRLNTDRDLGVARRVEVADDRLPVLGDAMSIPGVRWLVSFGDLIIVVGMIELGFALTRRRDEDDESRTAPVDIRDVNNAAIEEQIPDPWIALVRGDIDEATYGEVTGEIRPEFASPTPTTGVMRLNDSGSTELPWLRPAGDTAGIAPAPLNEPPAAPPRSATVPVMPSAEDDLDLSLVRWGDDTTPTSRASDVSGVDTGEMDLRQLQELLDDGARPTPPPPAEPTSVFAPPSTEPAPEPPFDTISEPAPEPPVEPAAVTITEPEPEPPVEPAAVTITEPEPQPPVEPAAVTITEPAPEPPADTVTEAVEPEPAPVAATVEPAVELTSAPPAETVTEAVEPAPAPVDATVTEAVEPEPAPVAATVEPAVELTSAPEPAAAEPLEDTGPIQLDLLDDDDLSAPSLFDEILARFDDSRREPRA